MHDIFLARLFRYKPLKKLYPILEECVGSISSHLATGICSNVRYSLNAFSNLNVRGGPFGAMFLYYFITQQIM